MFEEDRGLLEPTFEVSGYQRRRGRLEELDSPPQQKIGDALVRA